MTEAPIKIERAIVSVSDKTGLAEFCQRLAKLGVKLYSTGGTSKHLQQAGLSVTDIGDYTGFPEVMDGRVKTLHPKIHGGILCRRDHPEDQAVLAEQGISTFDLVIVNLYPFAATIARPDCTDAEAIENIDIGGPSLIRAAAKNHAFVAVVTRMEQYAEVARELEEHGGTSYALRRKLAGAAYALTAAYDRHVADYFARAGNSQDWPATITKQFSLLDELRYGENPHQRGALYAESGVTMAGTVVGANKLHGKELSYNNLLDLESALAIVRSLPQPAVSVIKHNNPCGAAMCGTLSQAARAALEGDPVSAFGSVLAMNRPLDEETADVLCEPNRFIEAIVAPEFTAQGLALLTSRPKWKANVRLLACGKLDPPRAHLDYRPILGGLLVQDADILPDDEASWKVVTQAQPTPAQMDDLRLAVHLVRYVKSNAITLVNQGGLIGVGAGQMSRVDSVKIATTKAGERSKGSVLGSDAFFPFPDSIEIAADCGVAAIIQPGGSKADNDVIAACNQRGLAMIFTGRRHFKH